MAKPITVEVTVKTDDSIEEMQQLAELIGELYDMVPEYLSYQSDPLVDKISEQFGNMITSKRQN